MNDEIRVPVSLPLDSDGFLRRECPTCERQFKWFAHDEGDPDAEVVDQYFCPLCGVASGTDTWWTPAQLEYVHGVSGPAIDQLTKDMIDDAFRGVKGVTLELDHSFTFGIEPPDALAEPDDMTVVEPPCHPNEPVKVPEVETARVHCLVCGALFCA